MQTTTEFAAYVEEDDFIALGEDAHKVKSIEDDGDFIVFNVTDDDGDVTQLAFGPWDAVPIVTSFEDPDED